MNNRSELWKTEWERRREEMGTERKGVGGGWDAKKKSGRWRERGRDIKRMSKGQSQIVRTPGRHMGVTERKTESDSFLRGRARRKEERSIKVMSLTIHPSIHSSFHPSIHPSVHPSLRPSPPRLLRGQELLRKTAVSSFIERGSFHKYVYLVRLEF